MAHPDRFAGFRLPDHLVALQSLVDRYEGFIMVTANLLETA